MNADELMSGYDAYTDAADFGASAGAQAPATTPSSAVCIQTAQIIVGSVVQSVQTGC